MGQLIGDIVTNIDNAQIADRTALEVRELLNAHPLYPEL